jgi:hypothetical protein
MFRSLENDAFAPPSAELRHSTNRDDEQVAFQRILDIPTSEPVPLLMFYGVGGAGKSWPLKRLRQHADQLPSAHIDLDPRLGGQAFLSDPSRVLGDLRRQMGSSVHCPRFDMAYTWLRFKEGVEDEPSFRGSGVLGNAWELVVEAGGGVVPMMFRARPSLPGLSTRPPHRSKRG